MIRKDEKTWLKCGIEYVKGVQQASTVITNEYSDWSVIALDSPPESIWIKLIWKRPAVEVYYSKDGGKTYTMMRLGYLAECGEAV